MASQRTNYTCSSAFHLMAFISSVISNDWFKNDKSNLRLFFISASSLIYLYSISGKQYEIITFFHTLWHSDTIGESEPTSKWLATFSTPSHYLNKAMLTLNLFENKFQCIWTKVLRKIFLLSSAKCKPFHLDLDDIHFDGNVPYQPYQITIIN